MRVGLAVRGPVRLSRTPIRSGPNARVQKIIGSIGASGLPDARSNASMAPESPIFDISPSPDGGPSPSSSAPRHSHPPATDDHANSSTLAADRSAGGRKPEPELDRLSDILRSFHELSGNIEWKNLDKINQVIKWRSPAKVAADKAYQNAKKNSDRQNARIEHDSALRRVRMELLADHTELFKQFSDNPGFKKWLSDMIFQSTYPNARPIAVSRVSPGL